MKTPRAGRTFLLALALMGVVALFLLAAGLETLEFHEARQYEQQRSETIALSVAALVEQIASVPMWKQIVFWVGVFFIVLLLSSMLSPETRKRLLWAIFRLALLVLAVIYLVQNRERFGLLPSSELLGEGGADSMPPPETVPLPSFTAPQISPALAYFLSVAVLLVVFGLFWMLSRGFASLRARPTPAAPLKDIADAARQSLDELASGQNWEDAIVRCYARMSDAAARRRGLLREDSMTPEEFASYLARSGLPVQSVQRLTRLFESVRYGARSAGEQERAEASACLTDILRYCGEAA